MKSSMTLYVYVPKCNNFVCNLTSNFFLTENSSLINYNWITMTCSLLFNFKIFRLLFITLIVLKVWIQI